MKITPMIGQEFNWLTVLSVDPEKPLKAVCRCRCGNTKSVSATGVKYGTIKSCGCMRAALAKTRGIKHGLAGHRLYKVWNSMVERCTAPHTRAWKRYGGRGITVCERWLDVANFIADMEPSYREGLTLDRRDNEQGYSLENCRWATTLAQNQNRSNSRHLTFGGETLPLAVWSERTGLSMNCIHFRLKRGWDAERIISTPARNH